MSFLVDAPWLYANGRALGAVIEEERTRTAVAAATMASFWAVSVSLYRDAGWTRPLLKVLPGDSGRDFMVNSGVFRFDPRRRPALHALIFATYPLWLWLGIRHSRH
jgi:hypothetical protein